MGAIKGIQQLKWLDLCSGIGAGFPFAGIKLWGKYPYRFCERDEFCQSILKTRYPGSEIISNIKDPSFRAKHGCGNYKADIITASPPCQPFSVDGKRLGADDERDCIPAVLGAIESIKPRFAIIENVTGLRTCPRRPGDKLGSYFLWMLERLSASGYDAEWQTISSGNFAAPWRRERLLILARSRSAQLDWERATPWHLQVRRSVEEVRTRFAGGSDKPGIPRSWLPVTAGIQQSNGNSVSVGISASPGAGIQFGVASGDGTNRDRRSALGNALDWRVAAVALKRVETLNRQLEQG
ncbi:MAG: DNA cytosine methyltransferase [Actinomycetota bacterium]